MSPEPMPWPLLATLVISTTEGFTAAATLSRLVWRAVVLDETVRAGADEEPRTTVLAFAAVAWPTRPPMTPPTARTASSASASSADGRRPRRPPGPPGGGGPPPPPPAAAAATGGAAPAPAWGARAAPGGGPAG